MAYTEYDYDSLAHLPEDVNCIVESSHSAKKEKEVSYLGGTTGSTLLLTVNVEIFTKTDAQAQEFYSWYTDTISDGTMPFTAIHELFGTEENFVLEIIDGIEEKIIGGNNRKINFTAEVMGISYPNCYILSNAEVLTGGTIKAPLLTIDIDRVYDVSKFSLDVGGVSCGITSAVRTDDILYIEADRAITDYPTVTLSHTQKEMGLIVFEQELINNSEVTRATVSENAIVSSDGTMITVPLDKSTYQYRWETSEDFIIQVDGETIPLSRDPLSYPATGANSILLYFDASRPIYQYEVVSIWFNDNTHIEISSFSNISAVNNSILASPEDNEIMYANINSTGLLTLADMSIPQDRTYDPLKTTLTLNSVSYPIPSIIQKAGTLIIDNAFTITDYVTSASLVHNTKEWGFDTVNYTLTNNSAILRTAFDSAHTDYNGRRLFINLDRIVTKFTWTDIANFTVKAGGTEIDIDNINITMTTIDNYSQIIIYITEERLIYYGETILVSYNETDNIEIAPFTDGSVENNSVIPAKMEITAATVASDGLSVSCTMSGENTASYYADNFTINSGYLSVTPTSAVQSSTTLTLTLPPESSNENSPIKDGTVVTLTLVNDDNNEGDKLVAVEDFSVTNNSTVAGATFVSALVVTTGQYVKVKVNETLKVHSWGISEFVVEINGTDEVTITEIYSLNDNTDIWIYLQDLILSTDTVKVKFITTNDPQLDSFIYQTVTNNSTETSQNETPPVYLMIEELSVVNGVYYLHNSAEAGILYDGKLCKPNGDPMTETEANTRYNAEEGTIDLSDEYYVDTQWTESATTDWNKTGNYDVISGESFKAYNIDFDFSASTVDIRLIDQDDDEFPSTPTYADVAYTPNTSSTWKITEDAPDIIYPSKLEYKMDSYTTV